MAVERGQRVVVHRRGQPEDGWYGWVDAVTEMDVVVELDQPTVWGRRVSFKPHEVFPAPPNPNA
jgi:hypothetical protein